MPMRFTRKWDFNPGNKQLDLNSLTQDSEVIAALQAALAIAMTGEAHQIPYSNLVSALQAVNVQAAIDEVNAKHEFLDQSLEGVLGGAGLNAEGVMDLLGGGALVAGDNVTLTYDDAAGTLTLDVTIPEVGLNAEDVMDLLGGGALVGGSGVTVSYDDAGGSITLTATTDAEVVRDSIASALVAGSRMTITVDDVANTITLQPTPQVVLLNAGQTAANVPAGTPVGTLIFTKAV